MLNIVYIQYQHIGIIIEEYMFNDLQTGLPPNAQLAGKFVTIAMETNSATEFQLNFGSNKVTYLYRRHTVSWFVCYADY